MWFALHQSKHHVATEPNWHSNRSQWAEKEFYCKSSPRGIMGILQESSYSWSLIIAKLPICKIRLHVNTTFKSETRTRRLWSPWDPLAVCAEMHERKRIRGKNRKKNKNRSRGTLFTKRNGNANHKKGLIMYLSSTIIFKLVNKESNKITNLRISPEDNTDFSYWGEQSCKGCVHIPPVLTQPCNNRLEMLSAALERRGGLLK